MKKLFLLCAVALTICLKTQAQYCSPTYTFANTSGDYLNSVQLGTINNLSGPSAALPNYTNFSSTMSATLLLGQTYNLVVQSGSYGSFNNIGAWIDFNHNLIFDPTEFIGVTPNLTSFQSWTITFTVPFTAIPGNTIMRVREIYGSSPTFDPCTNQSFGETEDYGIFIPPSAPLDAAIGQLIAPSNGCGLTSAEYFQVSVYNVGTDTIYSFNLSFDVNNGFSTGTNTVTATILPLASYTYTFTTPANLSTAGLNNLTFWVTAVGDTVQVDDTLHTSLINYPTINTYPYLDAYNSGSFSLYARVNNGANGTASVSSTAANTGAGGLLMEGSPNYTGFNLGTNEFSLNPSHIAEVSYCVDATNPGNCGLLLKFDLMQTYTFANWYSNFRVLINGVAISPTYQPTSSSSDPFVTHVIDLSPYIGTSFNLTFQSCNNYNSTYSSPGDNAYVDNISLFPHPPIDIAVIKIINPRIACGLTANEHVQITIKNSGCDTLHIGDTIPVHYVLNGASAVTENFILTAPLPFNDTVPYTFTATENMSAIGAYITTAGTQMTGDFENYNDSISAFAYNQPIVNTFPWYEDFESASPPWITTSPGGYFWGLYTSSSFFSPGINPHGGVQMAMYNTANYPTGATGDLISPCLDMTTLKNPAMKLYFFQYDYTFYSDYMIVLASIDGGNNYFQVDSITRTNPNFSTYPGGWQQFQICLPALAGQSNAKIKFRGYSAGGFYDMGLDDIVIYDAIDSSSISASQTVLCSGSGSTTVSISGTSQNYYYCVADHNHNNISNGTQQGSTATLTFLISSLAATDTLYIGYIDSLGHGYCENFSDSFVIIKVFPATNANAGADINTCSGTSNILGATGGVFYNWTPSLGLSSDTIANPIASPTISVTYILSASNQGGCATFDTLVYTVNPNPVANAGLDQVICGATTVTVGGTPTAASGTAPYTYSWFPASGLSSAMAANPIANPTALTAYTITVTDTNLCSNTDIVVVSVDATINHNATSSNITCFGANNGTASIGVSGGSGGFQYAWSTTPIQNTSSISGLSPNTYTITVTDALGCTVSDVVTIIEPPAVGITLSQMNTTCGNCNGKIFITATGGTPNYNFTSAPFIPIVGDSSINVCNGVYTISMTDQNGCPASSSVNVTGPGGSSGFVVSAGSDVSMCSGYSTNIGGVPTISGGTLPYTYIWTPAVNLTSITASNPLASPTATTTYIISANDGAGCSKNDTVVITVNPVPTANAGPDVAYCYGLSGAIGSTPIAGLSYSWAPSTGLSSATVANPIVGVYTSQVYTLTTTNTFGCKAYDQVNVTMNPLPTVSAGPDVIITTGNSTTLNGTGALTYLWTPGTALGNPNVASTSANPTATTTYTLSGTDANGCVDNDAVVVYVYDATGIDALTTEIGLKIYPNPFDQITNIEFELTKSTTLAIQLFDAAGRAVRQISAGEQSLGKHIITFDANDLSKGMYMLMIKTDDGVTIKRIVKQ